MFRQGLKLLLADLDDSLQFNEAGGRDDALKQLHESSPQLVLLDLHMPGARGLETLEAITQVAPETPVVVLSGEENPAIIRIAIDSGASGFVPKSSSSEILVAALQLILAGGIYLPANVIAAARTSEPPVADTAAVQSPLSSGQTRVLLRAIQGQPNKLIAADLGLAEGTIKAHLSAAYRSLGVRNRTEAVFAAAKLGLHPDPAPD